MPSASQGEGSITVLSSELSQEPLLNGCAEGRTKYLPTERKYSRYGGEDKVREMVLFYICIENKR